MREIFKQSSYLLFGQVLTKFIGFFYTLFLARNLGVLDFGLYSVGLAYFSIISSVADFGFNRFLIREIAREKMKLWQLLWNVIFLRLTLICIFFALFALSLYSFDQDKMRVSIILLATLAVLPQAIAITFDGIFIALQKLQFSAIATVLGSFFVASIGFILVRGGFGVFGAINALILGQLIFAFVLILLLHQKVGLNISEVKFAIIKKVLMGSLPYGLLGILGFLYFKIDTILLSYLKGNFETGIYATAYKFFEAVVFIPSALATALFPVLAKLHKENPHRIKKIYFRSLKILFVVSILTVSGYILFLPFVIRTFLPKFLPSIESIKILAIAIPFMFCHFPAVQVLFSTDKHLKSIILFSIILLSINIILNLIFIPKYGFVAASWLTVFSEALSFVIYFRFIMIKVFRR